jgi:hypothetical protein
MDSRQREQTPTKERKTAKTVEIRQEFAFFDKPVPSREDEIIETADIADQGKLIGALVGRVFTSSGEKISANGVHIAFTIHKGQDEVVTNVGNDAAFDPYGTRFENPVIYITFSSGRKYAGLGTREQSGNISFTDWLEVDKNEKEDKNKIKRLAQNHRSQPSPFRLHELIEAKYKIT